MSLGPAVLHITAEAVSVSAGGTGDAPSPDLVEAALDWIDDPIGLLAERPVLVADIWRSLMVTVLGPCCEAVVLVHPPDWPRSRIERMIAAANTVSDHIEAVSRDRWPVDTAPVSPAAGAEPEPPPAPARRGPGRLALGAVATGAVLAGLAVSPVPRPTAHSTAAGTLVEGRMAVRIPPGWPVYRVTGGPGSRRVQVSSPRDPALAVHLTWSYAPETTLAQAADVLGRAIAAEPPGVFADLQPSTLVAGRAAVTYRENRPGRVITWSVVVTGSTRIAIGCQSPPGREDDLREACLDAVRSAHEA